MPYQREVRLGIVLYGGVSLAVYENGVAQELYNAIRGDGVYGLIKDLIDSDIVVDIISGTSAGGVNGIMLAYALANKRQFAPSAKLWCDQGDIQALLRTEDDPVKDSILSSDYYQDKLADCYANGLLPWSNPAEAPSVSELDLFITGTDANGDIYTVFDDQGHAIDVKNHRALFKLSYRASNNRKNDLADAGPDNLAKLSRITSCFPVAFQPVRVNDAEKLFFRWGKLRHPAVYMDGGILNNKPFTSTIEAIQSRTANREVERFLIYVEPSPEVFAELAQGKQPDSPQIIQAAMAALLSIPGYQSIAGDLEAIDAHNLRAGRISEIIWRIDEAGLSGPLTDPNCIDAATVLPTEQNCDQTAYLTCRFIQLRDTAVEAIINDSKGRGYMASDDDRRRSARILVKSFDNWLGNPNTTLQEYDVFFRMRRAQYLSDSLMRRVKTGRDKTVDEASWDVVNHFIKLYEMAQWAMITWLDKWDYQWQSLASEYRDLDTKPADQQKAELQALSARVWDAAGARLQAFLQSEIPVPSDPTANTRQEFYLRLTAFLNAPPTLNRPPAPPAPNLLHLLDSAFISAIKASGTGQIGLLLRREFCRFADIDRQLFPIQMGSGFESNDIIRVVRFSPNDAQRGLSIGPASSKVCGTAVSSFGGFFKKSWRANDIMIGRFDAACQLIECLLTKERLAAVAAGKTLVPAQITAWFPRIAGKAAIDLAKSINDYLATARTASKQDWDTLIDAIVIACHDEIQAKEWPNVIVSAIEQESAWSRYLRQTKVPKPPYNTVGLEWTRAGAKPDNVLVQVAANAIASGNLPPFQPGAVAGRPFIDEIPDSVLQEIAFLAGIRLGKGLLESIPNSETRKRVQDSKFYRWPFQAILPVFYRWARMRRTQPQSVIVFNTIVPAVCATVLVVMSLLWFFGPPISYTERAEFMVPPALLFFIWYRFFRR